MNEETFYDEILADHNLHPGNKYDILDANLALEGVNPSCGDDIVLKLKVVDGVIQDGGFTGDGCAVSQASTDMMLDLVIGKTEAEAKRLADIFFRMIKGSITEEEREELEEAGILKDIAHMPARVKCAVFGWHTVEEMLSGNTEPVTTEDKQMGPNPLQLMKLLGMNQKFQKNRSKVSAFFRTQFAGGLTEDTILGLSIARPGEETVSTNMRIRKEDLELLEELKKTR